MLQLGLIKGAISVLNTVPKTVVTGASLALVLAVGVLDYSVGVNVSVLIFYLVPVVIATWFVGVRPGFWVVALSTVAIFYSQQHSLEVSLWNAATAGLMGLIVANLIHRVKVANEIEQQLSRTDAATGAINRRFFMELLETEFNRAERYRFALTLVYINFDNFKDISQQLGRETSDQMLYQFVEQISQTLRANDVIARLGEDEFAMLLPQTNSAQAQQVFTRLQPEISAALEYEGTTLDCSIGVVTFLEMPPTYETITEQAEQLVRQIKASGKSRLEYQTLP